MELRQIRYFVAVAEEGNISRAARRLFLTQPALSRQIKALEDEIGQTLLKREAHSIQLTATGLALLREGRELLRHAQELIERVRAAGTGLRLRIGYAPSLATGMLAAAVENFTQTHPSASVELFDLSTTEMLAGLQREEIDLALSVGQQRNMPGLNWMPLVRRPWQLAVSRNHPLARHRQITPEQVAQERMLVFCQRDYPEYWEMITGWMHRHRQRLRMAGEYDGVDSLLAAVGSGLGVALVTQRPGRLVPERVRLKPLTDPPEPLCISAGHRSASADEKPLAVMIEELRKAAQLSNPLSQA
jgi:DNA-binding transcriptional LysR family regulator